MNTNEWPKNEADWEMYGIAESLGASEEILNSNRGRVNGFIIGKKIPSGKFF